jgi:microcystin-dependent protein
MTIQQGEKMYAADILNLTFFPKGALLIFSSAAWSATSAEFKNIWKVCNAANHAIDGFVPDLTNKFLRGAESSGATGGSNSGSANVTLTATSLPAHSHPLSGTTLTTSSESQGHTHTVTAVGSISGNGTHTHSVADVYDPGHSHSFTGYDEDGGARGICGVASGNIGNPEASSGRVNSDRTGISITGGGNHTHAFSGGSATSSGASATHTHTVSLSGSTENSAGSSSVSVPVSVNTVPEYYTVIYIIKIV